MRIAVIGAGAIGMMLAGKLQQAGAEIILVTRTEGQAREIDQTGFIMEEQGIRQTIFVRTAHQASPSEPVDWILYTVKQTDVSGTIPLVERWFHSSTRGVVAFQNGWGHAEALKAIPLDLVFLATISFGAFKASPREILLLGQGELWLGSLAMGKRKADDTSVQSFVVLLNQAGLHSAYTERIIERAWEKWMINCAINPLTALLQVHNGALLQDEATIQIMKDIYEECKTVAQAYQVQIDPALWDKLLTVCRNTFDNRSSMLQDILAGRLTEVDAINGAMVKLAEDKGILLPLNQSLVRLIRSKERIGRKG